MSSPIEKAIKNGDLSSFTKDNVNELDMYGKTPLHYAVLINNLEHVTKLFEIEANPNIHDKSGKLAIFYATSVDIVKMLHKNGSRINTIDKNGSTPLHEAYRFGNYKLVECLIELGADKNIVNNNGFKPSQMDDSNDIAPD